jgi:hypothetical protein
MILRRFSRASVGCTQGLVVAAALWHLLTGQPLAASEQLQKDDQEPARPVQTGGFRERTNLALSVRFPVASAARKTQAKELISLYKQIGEARELLPAERSRLQARLKSRLARLADAIALDVKQAPPTGHPPAGNRPSTADQLSANRSSTGTEPLSASQAAPTGSQAAPTGSNGGAPQDDGQALVELIQATIAPQSWDVNGGPGSIVYWPAWHVLVVRQTDDVHEQIGGVVHGMRK